MEPLTVWQATTELLSQAVSVQQLAISAENLEISRESLDIAREGLEIARENLVDSRKADLRDIEKLKLYAVKTAEGSVEFERRTIDYTIRVFKKEPKDIAKMILRGHTPLNAFGYFLYFLHMFEYKNITLDASQAALLAAFQEFIDTESIWKSYLDGSVEDALDTAFAEIARIKKIRNHFAQLIARVKSKEGRNEDNFIVEFELLDSITNYYLDNEKFLDLKDLLTINKEIIQLFLARAIFHKYGLSPDSSITNLQHSIVEDNKDNLKGRKYSDFYIIALQSIVNRTTKDSLIRLTSFIEEHTRLFLSQIIMGNVPRSSYDQVNQKPYSDLMASFYVEKERKRIERKLSDYQYQPIKQVYKISSFLLSNSPEAHSMWMPLLEQAK